MGLPYVCDPSFAIQRTFFVVFGSIVSLLGGNLPLEISLGIPLAGATMLRSGVPPHIGQSFARVSDGVDTTARSERLNNEAVDRLGADMGKYNLLIGGDGKVVDEHALLTLR